jgi:HTH-type transcriptional regulator/antitoxin HigA
MARLRDANRAESRLDWLSNLPIRQLQDAGHLPAGRLTQSFKASLIEPALCFFGIASPEGWHGQYDRVQAAFHRANPAKQTDNAAITAWLRLGELQALKALKALKGVVLAFVPPFPRTHVSGVARWLGDRPLIQLSLLGKWNDVFWFSFFHEMAHILKHPKKAVFLDDASSGSAAESKEEKEADQFAADVLIPSADRKRLGQIELTVTGVRKFAKEVDIHPGIVTGCLGQPHEPVERSLPNRREVRR